MNKDIIYRQDAIDAINSHFGFNIEEEYGSAVQEVINGLPSAQSESKNGEWIRESLVTEYPYKCSACKKYSRAMYDFCPNCGADMRGEKEHE